MRIFIFIFILLFSYSAFSSYTEEKIIASFWNDQNPRGKEIEIKNVDIIKRHTYYAGRDFYSNVMRVYLWVRRDLTTSDFIKVFNYYDESKIPSYIGKVGYDYRDTHYFIYVAEYLLTSGNQMYMFYSAINLPEEGRTFYNNEDNPQRYFTFSFSI